MTDPVLDALWKRCLDDWSNDASHGAFIEHCQATRQLLEAAVRYRGMAGDHVRGPSASKRLEAIAFLALGGLELSRTPERRGMRVAAQIALIVLFVAATLALVAAVYG
jgi:hypothetical protein